MGNSQIPIIRIGLTADLNALADVEESAGSLFVGTHMAWAAEIPKRARDAYMPSLSQNLLWVAEVSGVVVGFIAASHHGDFIYVEEMSVHRDYQRRGIGRALLATLISSTKDRGASAVGLVTDRELPWNRPFYERAGFTVLANQSVPSELASYLAQEVERSREPARRCAMFKLH
jgi:ribosomal protein S18 acetylase RimI-like enzyme